MSGELEAAGALATAGAVAGAIEAREPGKPGEGACSNCGAGIEGRYCAQCGQGAYSHRSLVHMLGEFVHSVFHFDTKVWRTLPMVLFRPGTLTRNYVYGKRARYLSPLALFLLAIFAMFFVFSFVDAPVEVAGTPQQQRAAAVAQLAEAREQLAGAREALADERRELAGQPAEPSEPGAPRDLGVRLAAQAVTLAEAEVARREAHLAAIDAAIARASEEAPDVNAAASGGSPHSATQDTAAPGETEEIEGMSFSPGETWQDALRRAAEEEDFSVAPDNWALNERIRQNFRNPDLMIYKMQEAASKFSFLLAPLSLPFIALLFLWKRGVNLYDHVVYALYALAFASMLCAAAMLAAKTQWTSWVIPWLFALSLPVHMWFHLKGSYALGWWSATWRTFFMLIFANVVLAIFLSGVLFLGMVG